MCVVHNTRPCIMHIMYSWSTCSSASGFLFAGSSNLLAECTASSTASDENATSVFGASGNTSSVLWLVTILITLVAICIATIAFIQVRRNSDTLASMRHGGHAAKHPHFSSMQSVIHPHVREPGSGSGSGQADQEAAHSVDSDEFGVELIGSTFNLPMNDDMQMNRDIVLDPIQLPGNGSGADRAAAVAAAGVEPGSYYHNDRHRHEHSLTHASMRPSAPDEGDYKSY
jgi:hypothetical protein